MADSSARRGFCRMANSAAILALAAACVALFLVAWAAAGPGAARAAAGPGAAADAAGAAGAAGKKSEGFRPSYTTREECETKGGAPCALVLPSPPGAELYEPLTQADFWYR